MVPFALNFIDDMSSDEVVRASSEELPEFVQGGSESLVGASHSDGLSGPLPVTVG